MEIFQSESLRSLFNDLMVEEEINFAAWISEISFAFMFLISVLTLL